MSSIPAKDVIYIDVDDEITTIIDKVRSSQSKILALVLPKRATTLQSIVNMKLLKRSADETSKHLVLITGETGLMPLAANVGMYVAKNLQSKPEVPHVPSAIAELPDDFEESINLDEPDVKAVKPNLDKSAAVGDLARGSLSPSSLDDTINLDNGSTDKNPIMRAIPTTGAGAVVGGAGSAAAAGKNAPKGKKNRKLAIPNFNKFRLWLIIGGGGLALIIFLWVICFKVMPRASILVKTNSTAVDANISLTLSASAKSVSADGGVVPAQSQQTQKTLTGQADASGQRNDGQKASGQVTMTAKECAPNLGQPTSVPVGSAVSINGKTFITQETTMFSPLGSGKGSCLAYQAMGPTDIIAQVAGAASNIGSTADFSVAGRPDVSASGSTAGGTDQITKILQQSDIDAAKQKIAAQDTAAIKQQLQNQLTNMGLYPVPATFTASAPNVTTSASAGAEVANVTVTENVTYTMLGAKQADLKKLIANAVGEQIDTQKQTITDYGLGSAQFTAQNADNGNVAMRVTAVAGPDLKIDTLRKQVAGKKSADTKQIIKNNPGVTDVTVSYSPFWVSSTPSSTSKISITIDKPQTKANASN